MNIHKLVPVEPTDDMVDAAEEAYMPFGDMGLAIRMAILAAPAVQGEPAIRKLGIMGTAFDPPSVRRAYTYSHQPNNTTAWKLGRAAYKERSGGDFIDYGLQMLRYLQDEGFGVFEIDEADPAPQPTEQQPAPDVSGLVEALEQILGWRELRSGREFPIERIEDIARAALSAHRVRDKIRTYPDRETSHDNQ